MTSNAQTTPETETNGPSTSKDESVPEPIVSPTTKPAAPPLNPSNITGGRKRRENVREKGARLLVSGRLRVVKVDGNLIVAECKGDSGEVYKLGHDPRKMQYRCTCPAMGPCSHLIALQSVVAVER